jgi:protein involved in polysaccharide export with SLBB domain
VKSKYLFFIVHFLLIFGFPVSAQVDDKNNENIMLARSSPEYRVTPGDVYTLAYAVGATSVSYIIIVDTSYRIRVSNLGVVNGAGKTFMQLKSEVEAVVANNYPLSGVQLLLTQPATFRVYVNGEVLEAGEVPAWGLSRLSLFINDDSQNLRVIPRSGTLPRVGFLTPLASLRDVTVKSSSGQTRVYDLFKARRLGDMTQDPYLRPGDTITFNRVNRVVTILGAIERPGTYQLLDNENIKELIESYGSGFTPTADGSRVELVRMRNSADVAGDKIFLTEDNLTNNFVLEDADEITVPEITQLMPVLFVEGAIVAATAAQALDDMGTTTSGEAAGLVATNRLVVPFNRGETYAALVRKNVRWFASVSDTQNAYILRNGQRIPIDLNPALYDSSYRGEVLVQENDTLIVPFRQYFVTVSGAVATPGRYPYIPDRDWEYYIALAGGFVASRNRADAVTITDMAGKRMNKTDAISPETIITAKNNHPLYVFNQVAPVVTTILSIISATLSLWVAASR